jgi:hypothetical protein
VQIAFLSKPAANFPTALEEAAGDDRGAVDTAVSPIDPF